MKRQIIQVLHNLIGKGTRYDGQTEANEYAGQALAATEPAKSASVLRDGPVVQMIGQKNFEKVVNDILSGGKCQGCLLVCNVDRCKDINNIYGREKGDLVLHNIESVLCDVFRGYARIGSRSSDIFALWMPEMSDGDTDTLRAMTGMVNDRLLHPAGEFPPVSLSMGVSFCKPGDDCTSLVNKAHKALYIVKENGRCGCEMSL